MSIQWIQCRASEATRLGMRLYDALFIDDGSRFEYVGFESEAEKESFLHDWQQAVSELIQKSDGRYEIIDEINKAF